MNSQPPNSSLTKPDDFLGRYQFELPDELVARYPAEPPDSCRLLHLDRNQNTWHDHHFTDLEQLLKPGDLLVGNDTRVEARRIFLRRSQKGREPGARVESVFLSRQGPLWQVLIQKRKRLQDGEILAAEKDSSLLFKVHKLADGRTFLEEPFPLQSEDFSRAGQMPIPPYMQREENEADRIYYQNIFGKNSGSAAAPTASLHFTEDLIARLKQKGVDFSFLTLHIGYGTFAPLKPENFENKQLHREWYFIPEELALRLQKKDYRRLISIGTTTLRALETVYRASNGKFDRALSGETDIFLYPPERVLSADGLITNFHLPGSSLLLLTACMGSPDLVMRAYQHAVREKYRFYSYGDAMLIL